MAAKKKSSNAVVWILLGLLIIGLAGFGDSGFLSSRITSIARVGNAEVGANDYARALQAQIRGLERQTGQAIPMALVQAQGIDQQVRARLITQAALDSEAERIGISVGDENVSAAISSMAEFRGPGGAFDLATYRFNIQNSGMTVKEFEENIRREAARSILQAATVGGVATPENARAALVEHYATRRNVSIFRLDASTLAEPLPELTEAELRAYYEGHLESFTAPEQRRITYAWVTPDMLTDSVEVDAAAVRALYDSRADEYQRPERRLVERLVFADEASAEAALERINAGESFETIVAERGLELDDTDMGDVTQSQLGAAGEAVFGLTELGAVVGPFRSSVGPALFRMNAILAAASTEFEEVEEELRVQLALERARRVIADNFNDYEDLLAGDAQPEDFANETAMELGEITWGEGVSEGIAAYDEFREAARAASVGALLELETLSDGGVFVLRLDEIIPPAPRAFEEVREEVQAFAEAQQLEASLQAQAMELSSQLATQDLETFSEASGLLPETFESLTRIDILPDQPRALVELLHNSAVNEPVILAEDGQAWLAVVTEVQPADTEDERTARLVDAVNSELSAGLANDVYSYFARALEREAGIQYDQAAIDAVHANFR